LQRCEEDKTWNDVGDIAACRKTSKALGERGKRGKNSGVGDPSSPGASSSVEGDPVPGAAAITLGSAAASLAGTKRKMETHDNSNNAANNRSRLFDLQSSLSPNASFSSDNVLLQRLVGQAASASVAQAAGPSHSDFSALLQGMQAAGPSPAALLLAQAQLQHQREEEQRQLVLLSILNKSAGASAPPSSGPDLSSLASGLLGGSASNIAASPAPSATPLADTLALALQGERGLGGSNGPTNQLLDAVLARHILTTAIGARGTSATMNTAAASSNLASLSDNPRLPNSVSSLSYLSDALRRQEATTTAAASQPVAGPASTGTPARVPSSASALDQSILQQPIGNQNQMELLQLLANNHQLQGLDPLAALAAIRSAMGINNYSGSQQQL